MIKFSIGFAVASLIWSYATADYIPAKQCPDGAVSSTLDLRTNNLVCWYHNDLDHTFQPRVNKKARKIS